MKQKSLDLTLSSYVFDGSHPSMYRDRLGLPEERDPNYDNRYDFHTLIYDSHFDVGSGEVILTCPMLMNFRRLVEAANWRIDGAERPIKTITKLSRGEVIRFQSPSSDPKVITFEHPLFSGSLKINRQHNDIFAGKNAVYAISKDNKLEWIRDWLTYYVMEHGANAVVLYDNHSTAYDMDALNNALSGVPGIEAAALVRAWFPFGPGGVGNTNFNSKFLHMTMVELGRARLLGQARAVLNVDIDELVYSRAGTSIFDATIASEKGYVRIDGRWAFADPPEDGKLIQHADHAFVRTDGKPKVNRKYCVAPQGALGGKPWLTHRIVSRKDPSDPDFGFWHFRRISNNWDYNREDFDTSLLEIDKRLVDTMKRVYRSAPKLTKSNSKPKGQDEAQVERKAKNALIITAMKNEGPYILEWIAYHSLIGFDHFLVYTNDCSDGTDLILDRLAELGFVTHERNQVLRRGPQKSALKWAFNHRETQKADWILVSDVDEFLNIKIGKGTLTDLLTAAPEADVIPVTWRIFSNNGLEAFSENLVMEDYTDAELPISDGGQTDRFVKSIFRPRPGITRFGTHGPIHEATAFETIRWMAPDSSPVDPATCTRPKSTFAYDVAQINHYATRSVDSYLVKKDRGRVNHFRQVMGLEYWEKMNRGGERDLSISRWVESTKSEMARIVEDDTLRTLINNSVTWHINRISELRAQPEYDQLRNEIANLPSIAYKD